MSIEHIFIVVCEVPHCVAVGGRAKLPVNTAVSAGRAVAHAKSVGWRHINGRDLCPACWRAGWRYKGIQHRGDFYRRHR